MKARIVFMFSGQGSQYAGMGQELYQRNPVFRRCMDEFSEVAFPFLGLHLAEQVCSASDPESEIFVRTRYTNPALYMFNYAVAATLEAAGVVPDALLGYSLGELTAAAYNGTVDRFDLFIRLIRASVSLEQDAPGGGMLAVLDSYQVWDRYPDWFGGTSLASVNCARSFVVSGPATVLDTLQDKLQSSGILCQRLPVVQAFHSPWIDPARAAVFQELDALVLSGRGRVPLYSCVTPGVEDTSTSPRRFWDAMRQPVLFEMALQHLQSEASGLYIDVGPSGTLAAFAKLSLAAGSLSQALPVVDRFGLNQRGLQNARVKAAAHFLTPADRNVATVTLIRSDQRIACRFCAVSAWEYPELAAQRSQLLSKAELAYFEGLPVGRRQMSYLLGRVAAKTALASLIAEDDYRAIAITAGIFGQPMVQHQGAKGYDISISHNRDQAVAIAFDAGNPMGIDVEAADVSLYDTLLKAVPAEEAHCLSDSPSLERLLVLWTVKEALSKVLRCGMMTPAAVLAIESLTPVGLGQYQAVFRNFVQYQARSWVCDSTVLSIVLPLHTKIEFEPFQSISR